MGNVSNTSVAPNQQDLPDQWRKAFGQLPPRYISTRFMHRALGWEAQARAASGVPADIKRALQSIAKGKQTRLAMPRKVRAGTHLVRVWNGRTYQVDVIEDGFRMDGRDYGSLTAIARKITGTNWSGPRFFGLNGV